MLIIELTNRRGRALVTNPSRAEHWENIVGFCLTTDARKPRANFDMASAPLVASLLENPDEQGRAFGGVWFAPDSITFGGVVFPVTPEDRTRLIERVEQCARY